ncbi:MAG: hypothetical protein H7Y60_12810 [Rhodospirillaceae bacterium]|nr:hypothetical protein [Rhodospirillales bacterium]
MRAQCLIISTLTLQASIDTMLSDLGAALSRAGVFTRVLLDTPQTPNPALVQGLIADLRNYDGPRFVIDVNGKTQFFLKTAAGEPISVHDAWNIPRLSFFESSPLNHLSHLATAPKNLAISVVDPSHLRALKHLGLPTRAALLSPGPQPLHDVPQTTKRPIDVLFMGNLGPVPSEAEWLASLDLGPTVRAAQRAFDNHWHGEGDTLSAVLAACSEEDSPAPSLGGPVNPGH